MKKSFQRIVSIGLSVMLVFLLGACDKTREQSMGESGTKAFTPKYASDTAFKLSVVGTYSNFESLESSIERFYEHYP